MRSLCVPSTVPSSYHIQPSRKLCSRSQWVMSLASSLVNKFALFSLFPDKWVLRRCLHASLFRSFPVDLTVMFFSLSRFVFCLFFFAHNPLEVLFWGSPSDVSQWSCCRYLLIFFSNSSLFCWSVILGMRWEDSLEEKETQSVIWETVAHSSRLLVVPSLNVARRISTGLLSCRNLVCFKLA